jgi:transglutaminase-like putative cysteine protease
MRFSVCHETLYRYSGPVRLASHVLRLSPRPGGAVSVARSLTVDPTPTVRREVTDRFGNLVTQLDFEGVSDRLFIGSSFRP